MMCVLHSLFADLIRSWSSGQLNVTVGEPTAAATATATTIATAAAATTTAKSLNDLPEDVLLHILSFLPLQTAIKTSLISWRWYNLWSKLPSVYFPYSSPKFINKALFQLSTASLPLQKFYLEINYNCPFIESWIRYAIQHHVEELGIYIWIGSRNLSHWTYIDLFRFPLFLLRNGCVKVLRLEFCRIANFPNYMASMRISSLRTLYLDHVSFRNGLDVGDLISMCVNLESLSLETCDFDRKDVRFIDLENKRKKDVKICSFKLKELKLINYGFNDYDELDYYDESHEITGLLEITCPNLVSLSMINFVAENYDFKDLSGLIEAQVSFLPKLEYYRHWNQVAKSLAHVELLAIQNWWFKVIASKDDFCWSHLFCNLKHLELQIGYLKSDLLGIAELLEHSPWLETMTICYHEINEDKSLGICKKKRKELKEKPIHLNLPSLKKVEIRDFKSKKSASLVSLLSLLMLHGVVLEKIILVPPKLHKVPVSPTVIRRKLQQVKLSDDVLQKIKLTLVEGEFICALQQP